jgi:hypothetical protein
MLHTVFKTDVEVKFYKGTERDIGVIDIIVNDNQVAGIVLT